MKIHQLPGNITKVAKRVGRGIGSGRGKTAGRGTKGQGARSGGNRRPGFEGGQNPLMQRLPKQRGFTSFRKKAQVVHTDQLQNLGTSTITPAILAEAGLIKDAKHPVKLLARGKLSKKITVSLSGISAAALKQVENAGGSFKKVLSKQSKEHIKAKSK